jgi:hypothetical protein
MVLYGNFKTRDALGEATEAPDKSNKYKKFKDAIDFLYREVFKIKTVILPRKGLFNVVMYLICTSKT